MESSRSKKIHQCKSSEDLLHATEKIVEHWGEHYKVCVEEFLSIMYEPYSSDDSYSSYEFTDSNDSSDLGLSLKIQQNSTFSHLLEVIEPDLSAKINRAIPRSFVKK